MIRWNPRPTYSLASAAKVRTLAQARADRAALGNNAPLTDDRNRAYGAAFTGDLPCRAALLPNCQSGA